MPLKINYNGNSGFAVAVFAGLLAGYMNLPWIDQGASIISEVFINLLKLVSLPIIFLSIVATASGMKSAQDIRLMGLKVLKYTLLTTIFAATVALILFVLIDPTSSQITVQFTEIPKANQTGYLTYLLQAIPSNIVQPFSENNVIGVLFLAMLFSFAILSLPNDKRELLHAFFSALYAAIMKITTWIVWLMPFAICAFLTLFVRDMRAGLEIKSLALYLSCVVIANLVQAFLVLPLFLKLKKISPFQTAKAMLPALSLAFFSKSSSATLPLAMQCAEDRLKISRQVARFSFPLCTTINMNGCAAFILITVLFVSMHAGVVFSPVEMIAWIFIATIAAVGNAGVPMGCYFLASAFLATMNVPLNVLGVILPFYTLIDMLETAINVWSDSCVTTVVHHEIKEKMAAAKNAREAPVANLVQS
ncbi:dicarboxylate/amino acid:cation symporter [Parachlamydia sp. AcF125]|uniref:dicarboxylate/amino acid:cation symporter n=1 Tax=Parachlamydia sp. AcF125 TaxID=2795736 RepID=UPI001BC9DC37|nr:dicarboxylate/amino acid:cation symporter [Parachlamydia sp. AcF125]MBS4168872.1 Proton/glutamate-aspartate symporter [Parachlamydia sp. AcF125]